MKLTRRTVLAGGIGGIGAVISGPRLPSLADGYIRPDHDPETIPPELVCRESNLADLDVSGTIYEGEEIEEFRRLGAWHDEDDVRWGTLRGSFGLSTFTLRVNDLAFERGDDVRITFRQSSWFPQPRGVVEKASLEVYTEVGWQEVRGTANGHNVGATDPLLHSYPGWSHEYRFELSEAGVRRAVTDRHEDALLVCPELPVGRYRFTVGAPMDGDLAVAFDLLG